MLASLAAAPAVGDWCMLTPDSIEYFAAARTLHETGGFPDVFLMRPPGFATVIAPLFRYGEFPMFGLRVVLAICFFATGVLTYALYSRELGAGFAALAALLVAANGILLIHAAHALSEIVFLPMQLLALVILERIRTSHRIGSAAVAAAGLVVASAVVTRTIGAALVPVGLAVILLHRRTDISRRLAQCGVFMIAAASLPTAWHVRQASYSEGRGYADMWSTARPIENTDATGSALQIERLRKFGPLRIEAIKTAVIPHRLGWRAFQAENASIVTIIVAGLFGGIVLARAVWKRRPAEAYALMVFGVLMFWPWDEGVRMVVPLIPILLGGAAWLVAVTIRHGGTTGRWIAALFAMALLGSHLIEAGLFYRGLPRMEAKARQQVDVIREYAAAIESVVPTGASMVCVTPDGHNSKITFSGAAYLARRPIEAYLDHIGGVRPELGTMSSNYAVCHDSILDSRSFGEGPFELLTLGEMKIISSMSFCDNR